MGGSLPSPPTSAGADNADGRETVLREALAAARAIPRNTYSHAPCLACVAAHLPDDERDAVLREAVADARTLSVYQSRALALTEIVQSLPEPYRTVVLRELVEDINTELDKRGHPLIWRLLLPHLDEPERTAVVHDALTFIGTFRPAQRVDIVEVVAPFVPEALLPSALAVARAAMSGLQRARMLAYLVPYLPEASIPDMFVEATKISGDATLLVALAPRLPPSLRSRAIDIAVQPTFDVRARCQVLAALAPHLSEPHLRAALAFCSNRHGSTAGDVCADTVSALAPYLPATLLPEAFAAVRQIPDNPYTENHDGYVGELCRSRAFVALAPYLPEALLGDALAAYIAVPKHFGLIGTNAWTAFVPRLSAVLLPAALAAVAAIADAFPRVMFLAILAQRLAEDERQPAVRNALADTVTIQAPLRARALAALAPCLPAAERGTAPYEAFAEVLADLCLSVPSAPPPRSAGADGYATFRRWQIDNTDGMLRGSALTALAPHLPKELLPAALTAARTIHSDEHFVRTLVALLPHF